MQYSRTQIGIAIAACLLLVFGFLGYLVWLSNQGPVLARSEERDPLSGIPNSITLNPLRDRSSERAADRFIRAMRDGQCKEELADWEKDYRRKYAAFICASEAQHPLISWELVEWEDAPPLRILHYRGKRYTVAGKKGTYKDLFALTTEQQKGDWVVTKYEAMY